MHKDILDLNKRISRLAAGMTVGFVLMATMGTMAGMEFAELKRQFSEFKPRAEVTLEEIGTKAKELDEWSDRVAPRIREATKLAEENKKRVEELERNPWTNVPRIGSDPSSVGSAASVGSAPPSPEN